VPVIFDSSFMPSAAAAVQTQDRGFLESGVHRRIKQCT
jgi:hypothetical protein